MLTQTVTRNWKMYNHAQTEEKLLAMRLISHAIDYMEFPYEYKGTGRPSIYVTDMIKCCIFKVFNNFSSRRTICDIKLAHALGYIDHVPHFNTVNNYMSKEVITPLLHRVYKILALPFGDVETTFAIDASGFSNLRKNNWIDYRTQKKRIAGWKKLHIVTGVNTTIIASATVSEGKRNDTLYFDSLIRQTAKEFRVLEVLADPAYLSRNNCNTVEDVGGRPFILPKSNIRLRSLQAYSRARAWKKMIKVWRDNQQFFLEKYHKRSNVESAFSSMKRKFLPYTRSKNDTAQTNEILMKVICHNASILCNAFFELGIKFELKKV